ncbi:hypothetical protein [Xanthomonas sp. 3058]|uniref:hypothetical protein n=1 Tax=Xanthomonas sp. 3058 TaxID=3035314 RepID=UPI00161BD2D9|nr:hypothetical protein [Xanthomonas sp. 3058]MBB5865228.1 hypothetical protein [Xanthomonas sp. 3058]
MGAAAWPGLAARLRGFDADNGWLHWSSNTFDGWYCIRTAAGYAVYVQERGRR